MDLLTLGILYMVIGVSGLFVLWSVLTLNSVVDEIRMDEDKFYKQVRLRVDAYSLPTLN